MQDSRDFARLPLGSLIVRCALPAMVSMSAMALYSVIDGVFVGYFLGATALAAINLVFPMFMMFSSVIDMLAAGSSVQIATRLGAGWRREASKIFSFSLVAIFVVSIAVAIVAFIGTKPLLALMGAEPDVREQAATYPYILAGGAPICMFFFGTDNYLRICGWQNYSMTLNVGVALVNVVLDYLFIVVFGWGVAGAALATTIGIALGSLLSFVPSVMDLIVNTVLLSLGGTLAGAAFSVVMYLDSVVAMIVFGLTSALQPALSYCHGAGLTARTRCLPKAVMGVAGALSIGALALLQLGGPLALTFFVQPGDTALMELSLTALTIFALSYLVKWVDICVSSYFTALEQPTVSLALSLLGTLVAPLAALAVLVPCLGLTGVWWMPFAAGTISAAVSLACLRRLAF